MALVSYSKEAGGSDVSQNTAASMSSAVGSVLQRDGTENSRCQRPHQQRSQWVQENGKNALIILSALVFCYVTNMLCPSTTLLRSKWCVCAVYVFMYMQVEDLPRMGTRLIVPKTPFLAPTPMCIELVLLLIVPSK